MEPSSVETQNQREFARIPVHVPARVRQLDEGQLGRLRDALRVAPSIWAPSNEAGLRELSTSAGGEAEAVLAQSLLEITTQIVKLRARIFDDSEDSMPVDVVQLSGGGGQVMTPLPLKSGDMLELVLEDDEIPPIRCIIEIRTIYEGSPGAFGYRYDTIHPHDRDLLIRLIYSLQRQALRESSR